MATVVLLCELAQVAMSNATTGLDIPKWSLECVSGSPFNKIFLLCILRRCLWPSSYMHTICKQRCTCTKSLFTGTDSSHFDSSLYFILNWFKFQIISIADGQRYKWDRTKRLVCFWRWIFFLSLEVFRYSFVLFLPILTCRRHSIYPLCR